MLEPDEPDPEADEPELDEPQPEPKVVHTTKLVIPGRGKYGRKCKSAALEADKPEPEPEVAQTIEAQKPWKAPVAHMY
jgi:hypothetical protein